MSISLENSPLKCAHAAQCAASTSANKSFWHYKHY